VNIKLGYGKTTLEVNVPDKNLVDVLYANDIKHTNLNESAVSYALDNPIGDIKLIDKLNKLENKEDKKISIITSDITRPLPSKKIIPKILEILKSAGINSNNITIVFAIGAHRNQTKEEMEYLVGSDILNRVRCVDSTPDDVVNYGTTKNGTPIDISRVIAESDFVICIGNVEFHYFAGYSGGAKALFPGTSSARAIECNHKLMLDDNASAGNLTSNPIRDDIEEIAGKVGIDYIVNVVLDESKNIVYASAGDYIKAHRDACEYLDKMYLKPIKEKADIVIVSQGGYPKDINLYQLQKALDNAKSAVKDDGTIILVGECKDGLGNKIFEQYLTGAGKSSDIIDAIQKKFVLGGHKAGAIALVLKYANIDLVSSIDNILVESIFLTPRNSAQEALDIALKKYGDNAKVLVMPYGGSTLPKVIN
jgi:nickel-dependent lactate racemase